MDEPVVVVVEDDQAISGLLDLYLRRAGFRPLLAASGERGLELVAQHRPVLAVIDIGLPGIDGFEVCRRLRSTPGATSDVPVLFLTARDGEVDRIEGFEQGADDYVVKPFSPRELIARVTAILRRTAPADRSTGSRLIVDDVDVDINRREVLVHGAAVPLAMREFDVLVFLVRNRGLTLTRRQLLDGVWGIDWDGDERTVDVHVSQLRRKLGAPLPLTTVWGVGYRLG